MAKFTGEHLCWSLFLIRFQAWNVIKKRLQHRCFSVNFAKFLTTTVLKNISERLLLFIEHLQWLLLLKLFTLLSLFCTLFCWKLNAACVTWSSKWFVTHSCRQLSACLFWSMKAWYSNFQIQLKISWMFFTKFQSH